MARFFWQEVEDRPLENRYESLPGYGPWRQLVAEISRPPESYGGAFDAFLANLDNEPRPDPPTCCLFVSHRRSDVKDALRIASRATLAGYEYWLDIHDPTLIWLNGAAIPSPAKDILLAVAIEIGLLNSTHVIAMHTQHSIGPQHTILSKWIPYELGRAKARRIRSEQAACWFDQQTQPSACGEYVYLVVHTRTDPEIDHWLKTKKGRCKLSKALPPADGALAPFAP
jgi:hypothetical protein